VAVFLRGTREHLSPVVSVWYMFPCSSIKEHPDTSIAAWNVLHAFRQR